MRITVSVLRECPGGCGPFCTELGCLSGVTSHIEKALTSLQDELPLSLHLYLPNHSRCLGKCSKRPAERCCAVATARSCHTESRWFFSPLICSSSLLEGVFDKVHTLSPFLPQLSNLTGQDSTWFHHDPQVRLETV